ncbi:granulocyte colony-stimulating factor receptor [Spea bombifrons]|uniref:granulocyte colony-stimulating factor receptor n=1 Tax=Spea bombifrons TaxID=233779 RepID=UPI00234962A9|nr:granulocyte colony-stimulating factor receptor [Spea bombifrons]
MNLHILLGQIWLLFFLPGDVHSCDSITVNSPIVLGSRLLASCTVSKESCTGLDEDEYLIKWKLDSEFIPNTQYINLYKNTTLVYFKSFNKTQGLLSCYVSGKKELQLVDRKEVKAGYPPSPPTDLKCLMNLTDDSLKCAWKLGRDPLIETNVTLSSLKVNGQCEMSTEQQHDIVPLEDQMSGIIHRNYFNLYKKIVVWVTVRNALGAAVSETLCLVPIHEVKLDPPVIEEIVTSGPGCVRLQWRKGMKGGFIASQSYQLQYRREDEIEWTGPLDVIAGLNETIICSLKSARKYHFQLRSIRSSKTGVWSEWGQERSLTTSETAPTGKLETWWKSTESTDRLPVKVHLFWKALKREEANAEHIWYIVRTSSVLDGNDIIVCNTTGFNCSFFKPPEVKGAVIMAYNTAGHSQGTEITFSPRKGAPVSSIRVSANDDYSLRVEWEPETSAKEYILEYKRTSDPDFEINWKSEPRESHASILYDNVEPFVRYTVRLYPLYEEQVGHPVETDAYSRQGAPAISPKIKLIKASKSQAVLSWEPIPLESRNGFITGYTIFWTDPKGYGHFADLKNSSTKYVIKNLESFSIYKVVLSSSTSGGSTNGTVMVIHTTLLDEIEVSILIMVLCLFCAVAILCICILCVMKHERVKNHFWPSVPDPANSSMGKWTCVEQEKPKMTFVLRDANQTNTTDITILEDWQVKKPSAANLAKHSNSQQDYYKKSHVQPKSHRENMNTLRSYANVGDTVQYAKVITGGYREQSPPSSLYIRSDSTQPLLCDTSPSPKNYENMWFHCNNQEDSVFFVEENTLHDFPLLQALKIQEEGAPFSLYG